MNHPHFFSGLMRFAKLAPALAAALALSACDFCYVLCSDSTTVQIDYVAARDKCQDYSEDNASRYMAGNADSKTRNTTLLALFSDCMHQNGWGVSSPKQDGNSNQTAYLEQPLQDTTISRSASTATAASAAPVATAAATAEQEQLSRAQQDLQRREAELQRREALQRQYEYERQQQAAQQRADAERQQFTQMQQRQLQAQQDQTAATQKMVQQQQTLSQQQQQMLQQQQAQQSQQEQLLRAQQAAAAQQQQRTVQPLPQAAAPAPQSSYGYQPATPPRVVDWQGTSRY